MNIVHEVSVLGIRTSLYALKLWASPWIDHWARTGAVGRGQVTPRHPRISILSWANLMIMLVVIGVIEVNYFQLRLLSHGRRGRDTLHVLLLMPAGSRALLWLHGRSDSMMSTRCNVQVVLSKLFQAKAMPNTDGPETLGAGSRSIRAKHTSQPCQPIGGCCANH